MFYQAGVCMPYVGNTGYGPQSTVVFAATNKATGKMTFNTTVYTGSLTCRFVASWPPPSHHRRLLTFLMPSVVLLLH